MPVYNCPMCGYSTKIKTHMRNHFNRQVTCKPLHEDLNISQCCILVLGEKSDNISSKYLILPEKCLISKPECLILPEKCLNLPEKCLILPENCLILPENDKSTVDQGILEIKPPKKIKRRKKVECPFCNKIYSRKDNLKVHIETSCREYNIDYNLDNNLEENSSEETESVQSNSLNIMNIPIVATDTITNLKTQLDYEKKLREKDREHIEGLKKQVEMLLDKVGDTYNTNTYNIVIKPFGEENTSYITGDIVRKIIKDGPYSSIPKLLEYIHFNPEHKENHNIKITNKKQPYAQIFNGKKWLLQDKKQTIEDMSDKAFTIINKHYYGANDYMNKFKTEYTGCNLDLNKRLMRDVELSILNSQKNILTK